MISNNAFRSAGLKEVEPDHSSGSFRQKPFLWMGSAEVFVAKVTLCDRSLEAFSISLV